ncbi:MAG: hypothetical protein ACT4O2_14630 [Beijerinckiaceae bacterium]
MAGEINQPFPGPGGDGRHFAGPWAVVQGRQWAKGRGPLDAALDGLMLHAEQTAHREERRVRSLGQKHARPLDPARRFGSRPRHRHQLRHDFFSNAHFDHKPRRRHDARPRFTNHQTKLHNIAAQKNPAQMIGSMESVY